MATLVSAAHAPTKLLLPLNEITKLFLSLLWAENYFFFEKLLILLSLVRFQLFVQLCYLTSEELPSLYRSAEKVLN